jgi:hypothetical protein
MKWFLITIKLKNVQNSCQWYKCPKYKKKFNDGDLSFDWALKVGSKMNNSTF